MQTVPNQKIITIHKLPRKGEELFTAFSQYVQQHVMNDLNKIGSLKLWMYLTKNQDAYTFALSPAACSDWGIGQDAYKAGVKDLIEKGYLVPTQAKNSFIFYDLPQSKPQTEQDAQIVPQEVTLQVPTDTTTQTKATDLLGDLADALDYTVPKPERVWSRDPAIYDPQYDDYEYVG